MRRKQWEPGFPLINDRIVIRNVGMAPARNVRLFVDGIEISAGSEEGVGTDGFVAEAPFPLQELGPDGGEYYLQFNTGFSDGSPWYFQLRWSDDYSDERSWSTEAGLTY